MIQKATDQGKLGLQKSSLGVQEGMAFGEGTKPTSCLCPRIHFYFLRPENFLQQPLSCPVGFVLTRPPEEWGWVLDTTEETDWLKQSTGPTATFTHLRGPHSLLYHLTSHCPISSLF